VDDETAGSREKPPTASSSRVSARRSVVMRAETVTLASTASRP